MARVVTDNELTYLRSDNQFSKMSLAVQLPEAIFSCQVNQAFTTLDGVTEITYNNVTYGTYTSVKEDMTLYVGSAAGAHDLGMCRIRLTPTTSVLYINETSEIGWANDLYLTVVNEFSIWARHMKVYDYGDENIEFYVDYDIEYSDQHEDWSPIPVLGPHAVKMLPYGSVDVEFDASDSWVIGSSITGFQWVADGAGGTSGMNTATPTITYYSAGTYRVSCTVTAANGKTTEGHRFVFVYTPDSPPVTKFQLESCSGNFERGGWKAEITIYDDPYGEADFSVIRDRALCVLFTEDHYGGDEVSLGPVSDRENIVMIGWVLGESIDENPDIPGVTFIIEGANGWLDKVPGYPIGVEDTDFKDNEGGAPNRWTEVETLTLDKGLAHFLMYRSTAYRCMDILLSDDTRRMGVVESYGTSLWQQLVSTAYTTIRAMPLTDRYSRLFIEIDSQFLSKDDRSSIPVVQKIAAEDWREQLIIIRDGTNRVAQLEASGTVYSGEEAYAEPLFSRAPGVEVAGSFGIIRMEDKLALANQDQLNDLTGMIFANDNNEYAKIEFKMASNYRMADICPRQYLTTSLRDTARGVTWSNFKVIPRVVSFELEEKTGIMLTDIAC